MPSKQKDQNEQKIGLGDNPIQFTTEDKLGFIDQGFIPAVCNIIKTCDTPYTVGIFGDWGTGKSSIMNLIADILANDDHIVITFNPWKYDTREGVRKALIRNVYTKLRAQLDYRKLFKDVSYDKLNEFLDLQKKHLKETGGKGLVNLSNFLGRKAGFGDVGSDLANAFSIDETFIDKMATELQHLVDSLLPGDTDQDKRVILFIDDLDRCAPETIMEVIEAVRLYLDQKRFVFVFGIAQKRVKEAIGCKYSKLINQTEPGVAVENSIEQNAALNRFCAEFLEKIINLPFYVPIPIDDKLKEFAKFYASQQSAFKENTQSDEFKKLVNFAFLCSKKNPRAIKRYISTHKLYSDIIDERKASDKKKWDKLLIAKTLAIQFVDADFWEEAYRKDPAQLIVDENRVKERSSIELKQTDKSPFDEVEEKILSSLVERKEPEIIVSSKTYANEELFAILKEEPFFNDIPTAIKYIHLALPAADPEEFPIDKSLQQLLEELIELGTYTDVDRFVKRHKDRLQQPDAVSELIKVLSVKEHPLLKNLDEPEAHNLKNNAIKTLGQIGPDAKSAVDTLINILEDDKLYPTLHQLSASALGQIDPRSQPVITTLINLISNNMKNYQLRLDSAIALGHSGSAAEPGMQILINIVIDNEENILLRFVSFIVLEKIGLEKINVNNELIELFQEFRENLLSTFPEDIQVIFAHPIKILEKFINENS